MDGIKLSDQAESFFLYEYFGIVRDSVTIGARTVLADNEKSAAIKCAYRAYLDLCRTLTYKDNVSEEEKSVFLKTVCTKLVTELLKGGTLAARRKKAFSIFSDEEVEDQISSLFTISHIKSKDESGKRNTKRFYFGHVQKWVNMTIKYMLMIGIIKEDHEGRMDIPLDRFIMKATSHNFKDIKYPRNEKEYNDQYSLCKELDYNQWKKYSEDNTMPWSKLEENEYDLIQQHLDCHSISTEWENNAWIAESIFEANKDKTKKWLNTPNFPQK